EPALGIFAGPRLAHADRDGDPERLSGVIDGHRSNRVEEPLAEQDPLLQLRIAKDDGKLVAAETGHDIVSSPKRAHQAVGKAAKHFVAGGMAVVVVDGLEVVDVDDEKARG